MILLFAFAEVGWVLAWVIGFVNSVGYLLWPFVFIYLFVDLVFVWLFCAVSCLFWMVMLIVLLVTVLVWLLVIRLGCWLLRLWWFVVVVAMLLGIVLSRFVYLLWFGLFWMNGLYGIGRCCCCFICVFVVWVFMICCWISLIWVCLWLRCFYFGVFMVMWLEFWVVFGLTGALWFCLDALFCWLRVLVGLLNC